MSAPAQIPGFYYDPDKKKYFCLLPSHQAPTSSFYSQSTVKQQQKENKRKKDQQQQEEARRLRRKRLLALQTSPFARVSLGRELGIASREDERESARQVYASGLERHPIFELESGSKIAAFAIDRAGDETRIILGTSAGDLRYVSAKKNDEGIMECDRATVTSLYHSWSPVTSISISSQKLLLTTFVGDNRSPSLYLTGMPEPGLQGLRSQVGIETVFRNRSIWTSGASPHANGDLLIGTSTGASIIQNPEHTADIKSRHFGTRSDVFAVEFLPQEPAVFLCGSRDGGMRLFDVRIRSSNIRSVAEIVVRHGSPITHLRTISEVGVVVNGLHGCAMYDLRFPHPAAPSAAFAEPTRAYKSYPHAARSDRYMIELGFDVNRTRGIMAVANQEHSVELFSIATGEKLDSKVGRHKFRTPCKAMRFDREEVPEGLFAADGTMLDWHGY